MDPASDLYSDQPLLVVAGGARCVEMIFLTTSWRVQLMNRFSLEQQPTPEEQQDLPALSIVLATPDDFASIEKTISYLLRQTVIAQLELVIVARSVERLGVKPDCLSAFASFQVIEIGPFDAIGHANAEGVRHARSPWVVLAEDHCFPEAEWAEQFLAVQDGAWVAIGPGIKNANPGTKISWADLFIGYGVWLLPTSSREVDFLPGHNSCYRRDVLLDYGDQLDEMLQAETVLHWDLRGKGFRLFLNSACVVAHTNFSLWSAWLKAMLYHGRVFASSRSEEMTLARRSLYVFGSPLIPLVRAFKIWGALTNWELRRRYLNCFSILLVGLTVNGFGELLGYAFGPGRAPELVGQYEFHRAQHICEQDRGELFDD